MSCFYLSFQTSFILICEKSGNKSAYFTKEIILKFLSESYMKESDLIDTHYLIDDCFWSVSLGFFKVR